MPNFPGAVEAVCSTADGTWVQASVRVNTPYAYAVFKNVSDSLREPGVGLLPVRGTREAPGRRPGAGGAAGSGARGRLLAGVGLAFLHATRWLTGPAPFLLPQQRLLYTLDTLVPKPCFSANYSSFQYASGENGACVC